MTHVNGHDKTEEATKYSVDDRDGMALLRFSKPTQNLAIPPENAFMMAEQLARAAHRAKFGNENFINGAYLTQQIKARLTEELRDRMVVRAMHVMRSLTEKGKHPEFVAREIVDSIFAEVDR